MLDLLDRGPLMDAAGGADSGGGTAVADAASDFGGGTTADTSVADTSGGEVHDAEFVEPVTGDVPRETGTAVVKAGERAIQNGKFTGSGRAIIEALTPLGSHARQMVTQALLTRDFFLREFPGGKREIAQLRQLAQKSGGEDGIGELQSIAQQMEEIDRLYEASDPSFIDKITETDDGQRSFVGLMAPAFDRFEKLGGEQFKYQIAKRFQHLTDVARVPTLFTTQTAILNRATAALKAGNQELAASFLAEIVDNHNSLLDFFQKVYDAANTAPADASRPSNPQLDERTKALTQREQALQRQEWEAAVAAERRRLFSKAWGELTKGRTLTATQDDEIKGFYELKLNLAMKGWQNQAARFFSNGDKDGYLREQFQFFQRAIPESLRYAIGRAVPAKPGPKGSTGPIRPPVGSNGTQNRGNGATAAIRVAKMPAASQLDAIRTTAELLRQSRAYGKDGKLYQWA